ncbi:outer membrane protein [Mesorhizobium marinum]|uniref:outer membrane protein n=1 Tax=Mesorhizobium marinum TaxID=3228790 RepID=UPI003466CAB6
MKGIYSMKLKVFAVAMLIGSSSHVLAADAVLGDVVVIENAHDWSGLYAGVLLGYGAGDTTARGNPGFDGSAPNDTANLDPDGFVGGAVAGYNWQRNQWVFGIEGEIGYLGAEDDVFEPDGDDFFANTDYGLYGSLTGRVGVAFDRTLFALRGGVIVSEIDYGYGDTDGDLPDPSASIFGSDTRAGYTLGASIEHAFTGDWIGRLDYSYSDFGSHTETDLDGDDYDISDNLHMIRIGISRKF